MGSRKYTQVKIKSLRRRARKKIIGDLSSYEKQFEYRGKTIEELKSMETEQLLPLYTSSVRRRYKRGFCPTRMKIISKIENATKEVRTHYRDLPITPRMIGKEVGIYNGKKYISVVLKEEMVGKYLGEFSQTRIFPKHVRKGVGASKGTSKVSLK